VILCLTKSDLLEQKLKIKQFKDYFPDFAGENTVRDVTEYITQQHQK